MHRRRPGPTRRPGSFFPPDARPRGRRVRATKPPADPKPTASTRRKDSQDDTQDSGRRGPHPRRRSCLGCRLCSGLPGPDCEGHRTLALEHQGRRPADHPGQLLRLTAGQSTVTFGERLVTTPSLRHWAPCAKKARVISWSGSSITVRVPSMAPGSHKVYVRSAGRRRTPTHSASTPSRRSATGHTDVPVAKATWSRGGHDVLYDGLHLHRHQPQHRRRLVRGADDEGGRDSERNLPQLYLHEQHRTRQRTGCLWHRRGQGRELGRGGCR